MRSHDASEPAEHVYAGPGIMILPRVRTAPEARPGSVLRSLPREAPPALPGGQADGGPDPAPSGARQTESAMSLPVTGGRRDSLVDRRVVVSSLAFGTLAVPRMIAAQPSLKKARIGVLGLRATADLVGPLPKSPSTRALLLGLGKLGYVSAFGLNDPAIRTRPRRSGEPLCTSRRRSRPRTSSRKRSGT